MSRAICLETKLGRLLYDRNIPAYELGAYVKRSPRLMTEYCAGRRRIPPDVLKRMAEFFNLDPEFILEDEPEELELDMAVVQPRVNPAQLSQQHKQRLGRA